VGDLENNPVTAQARGPIGAPWVCSDASSCAGAVAGWPPTMALPHCGQCQPAFVRTIATRQIGQDRMGVVKE
jgi:hypothetical protein